MKFCLNLGCEGGVSTIVGETLLKLLAGKEDAALDSAEGEVHFFGDFVVFVSGHVH